MTRNETVYNLASEWVVWLDSKKFFGQAPSQNILSLLMKLGSRKFVDPDGCLSQEMSAFNTAFHAQSSDHQIPFIVVYCELKTKPIKAIAYDLGIERATFYNRAHTAANSIGRLTRVILEDRLEQHKLFADTLPNRL